MHALTGGGARAVAAALVACASLAGGVARADGDVATAQVLFDDGKRLMVQGRYAEACPKLADSQRLAPGVGTEFNLADCWEHVGKLASAWAGFLDVVDQTHKRGEAQREAAARARADAIAPRLGRLSIRVESPADDLEVRRDGEVVPRAAWGVALPADAGEHRVEARATGRVAWTGTVTTRDGGAASIVVPALAPAPLDATRRDAPAAGAAGAPAPTVVVVAPPGGSDGPSHTAAIVAFGAAAVFAGVGVAGLLERSANISSYNADATCPPIADTNRSSTCSGYVDAASTWGTVGAVGLAAGGVALVTGITLWIVAPGRAPAAAAPASRVGCAPVGAGVACGAVF